MSEQQHIERVLTRQFIEGTDDPALDKSRLARLLSNHNLAMVDKSDMRQKWQIYSHLATNIQDSSAHLRGELKQLNDELALATIRRNDIQSGLRLLRKLIVFNLRRCEGEEDLHMHTFIDPRLRRMQASEIIRDMKKNVFAVQRWQELNSAVEGLLLNGKEYVQNIGELRLLYADTRSGLKEAIDLRQRISSEADKKDYFEQKVVRQTEQIDRLSKTMEAVSGDRARSMYMAGECIDVQGDILTAQKSIQEKMYGNRKEQEEELVMLKRQCVSLVKVREEQNVEMHRIEKRISMKQQVGEYYRLNVKLQAVTERVSALEDQIKKSGKEFAKELARMSLVIAERKQTISELSMSTISYTLPSEINSMSKSIISALD